MNSDFVLDKFAVRKSFSEASVYYDGLAVLQRKVADRLFSKIDSDDRVEGCYLDIGCGTGFLTERMLTLPVCRRLVAVDIAMGMLKLSREKFTDRSNIHYLCADAERLPFRECSVDGMVSNLALQWCNNPVSLFADFARVLKPQGRLWFSTFGAASLSELSAAWKKADDFIHVNRFFSRSELGGFLVEAGFREIRLEKVQYVSHYREVTDLMRELKGIGAGNANHGRFRGMTGKNRMSRMVAAYEEYRQNEMLPATYEIFVVSARVK